MTLMEAIKNSEGQAMIIYDNKWMYWCEGEWHVIEKEFVKQKRKVIYRGVSEQEAVEKLLREDLI